MFRPTDKQIEAQKVVNAGYRHILYDGGSRSGKTFWHLANIAARALKAPGSRHAVLRFRFNHCKQSIVMDTWPKMMRLMYPDVSPHVNKSEWFWKGPNDSEIWFGGLDDKERTEKILGNEYATIYLCECSQLSWDSVTTVRTRLAQKVMQKNNGKPLSLRMFYDCNPPSKAHWTYKAFYLHQDPETREALRNPEQYAVVKMNPQDNEDNLPPEYFDELSSLSARARLRFFEGQYGDATPGQLIMEEDVEKWRAMDGERIPDLVRVVVGVDPSGADDEDNVDNDAIGIVCGAIGTDGNAYLLEDATVKAGPGTWGRVAASCWERHKGDCIVGEINFGGAMVKHTIKVANSRIPFRKVTASRGKVQRVEPFAALYEQGKIRHVGYFRELEEELTAFNTHGYLGSNSPNRADAWIWVLAELFSGLTREKPKPVQTENEYVDYMPGGNSWMG